MSIKTEKIAPPDHLERFKQDGCDRAHARAWQPLDARGSARLLAPFGNQVKNDQVKRTETLKGIRKSVIL